MDIELKHPIIVKKGSKVVKEIKVISSERLKVKHFKLLPMSLLEKVAKENEDKPESEKGKIDFSKIGIAEMLPMFNDLIPFIGGIFGLTIAEANEIDFDDIEPVIEALGDVFSEKK